MEDMSLHPPLSSSTSKVRTMSRIPLSSSLDEAAPPSTDETLSFSKHDAFTSPQQGLSSDDDASTQLRRRTPLSPIVNMKSKKSRIETPRMWKEQSSNANEITTTKRRNSKSTRNVSFSPPPNEHLSYFTIQSRLSQDEGSAHISSDRVDDLSVLDTDQLDYQNVDGSGPRLQQQLHKEDEEHWYHAPTQLHEICYSSKSVHDLQQLKSFFQNNCSASHEIMSAARRKDNHGRIPLHLLSENTALSEAVFGNQDGTDDWASPELQSSSSFAYDMTPGDRAVSKFVIDLLLPANPSGLNWRDADGYLPFERALVDWVDDAHESWLSAKNFSQHQSRRRSLLGGPSAAVTTERIQNVLMSTSMSVTTAINWAGRSLHLNRSWRSFQDDADLEQAPSNDTKEGGSLPKTESSDSHPKHFRQDRTRLFPLNVRLSPHLRLTLTLLSDILDKLDESLSQSRSFRRKSLAREKQGGDLHDSFDMAAKDFRDHSQDCNSLGISDAVVDSLSSTPDLVKTLLLLKDDDERSWAFSCSVIRRITLNKNSIGPWLIAMLQNPNKNVSERAVQYLRIISDVCEEEKELYKSSLNINRASKKQEDFLNQISNLEGLVPSFLSLDNEKDIEDAATTPIIKGVLDKMIARPFAVSVVFFDALFLLILIIAFRASVVGFLTGEAPSTVLKWIYVANAGIFYFIIRELGKAISLCMITHEVRTYFLSFWNISDLLAIIFALSSTIAMRVNFSHDDLDLDNLTQLRGCLAITTGLLWLRVLSLLKTINMQLATFVLAIIQITRDILWFLLILFTMVVAFAQMFYTLLIPASCASQDVAEDDRQCSPAEYYLSTYSILLGDFGAFERDDFTTWFSVLLIVIFSFMVVIVLLNVLIAIVSDSYEKCLIRSQNLFGRARVMLLAELDAFQHLLGNISDLQLEEDQDKSSPPTCIERWWERPFQKMGCRTRSSALFFSLSALIVLVWIIGETAGYFSGERYGNFLFSICSILVNVLLFVAIVVFLSKSANANAGEVHSKDKDSESTESKNRSHKSKCIHCISTWYEQFIQKAMRRLLGSTNQESSSFASRAGEAEEWRGRVHHLQREMTRLAHESSSCLADQTKSLEQHIVGSESRIRGELTDFETKMADFQMEMVKQLKESEKRTDEMIRHNMNELLRTLTASKSLECLHS